MVLDFTWKRQRELIAKENFTNGEAIGEARGEARGEAKGEAKTILRLLELRFGEIPEGLRNELFSEKAEALSSVLEPAAKAKSLEEFRERYHQIKYLT